MKNKKKPNWKLEFIKEQKKRRFNLRLLYFTEIIYHTITPIILTYLFVRYSNAIYLIPLLFIIAVRLKIGEK